MSKRAHYSPPWADVSIIGVAGSSGSGKSTLSHAIVAKLNLPWVVILSMDSFYKTLDGASQELAFQNEYDFDSPDAIDFDALVDSLRDLKAGFVPLLYLFRVRRNYLDKRHPIQPSNSKHDVSSIQRLEVKYLSYPSGQVGRRMASSTGQL